VKGKTISPVGRGVVAGAGFAARRREARAIGRGITNERLPAHTRRL
jgi:hypothetical protein